MEVILYKNNDYKNKIVKTLGSTEKYCTLSKVILHDETSLLNPSLLVDLNDFINVLAESKRVGYVYEDESSEKYSHVVYTKAISDLCSCNYVYIKEFNRYYFIEDISIFRTNLWRIKCHVDVLTSYQNEILEQYLFISRSSSADSTQYEDNLAIYSPINNIDEKELPTGSFVNTKFGETKDSSQPGYNSITISVINNQNDKFWQRYRDSFNILPGSYLYQQANPGITTYVLTRYLDLERVAYQLTSTDSSKYSSYVISACVFPFEIPHESNSDSNLYLGSDGKLENIWYNYLSIKNHVVADFIYSNSAITKDLYAKTSISLYIPYVGWQDFNTQDIINKQILVVYNVNYSTGESVVSVIDYNNQKLLFTTQCQLGRQVSITSSNQNEVTANSVSQGISLGVGALTSAVSLGVGVATANPIAVAGGVSGMAKTVSSFATGQMTNYQKASGNVANMIGGITLPQKVRIKVVYPSRKNRTTSFAQTFGYPLNDMRYLNAFSDKNYFICENVQLSNMNTATKTEQEEIKSLLESGVYK